MTTRLSVDEAVKLDSLAHQIFLATGNETFKIGGNFWSNNVPRLTPVPKYLERSEVLYVLGDGENPKIKLIFFRLNGPPEMKCLKFTLDEYFEEAKNWGLKLTQRQT